MKVNEILLIFLIFIGLLVYIPTIYMILLAFNNIQERRWQEARQELLRLAS